MAELKELKIPVEVKMEIPTATAEGCLKILEMWVNEKKGREIIGNSTACGGIHFTLIEKE